MDEGVAHLCEQLRLMELENEETHIELSSVEEVVNRSKNCLLVKLLSTKYYNREAFKVTMKKVWCPTQALRFSEIRDNLMMAEFEN